MGLLDKVQHIEDYVQQIESNMQPRNSNLRIWMDVMEYVARLKNMIPKVYTKEFLYTFDRAKGRHKFKLGTKEMIRKCDKSMVVKNHVIKYNVSEEVQETCFIFNFFGSMKYGMDNN